MNVLHTHMCVLPDVCKDSDAETYTSGRAKTGALCKTTGNAYSRCYEGGCDNLWETVAHEVFTIVRVELSTKRGFTISFSMVT